MTRFYLQVRHIGQKTNAWRNWAIETATLNHSVHQRLKLESGKQNNLKIKQQSKKIKQIKPSQFFEMYPVLDEIGYLPSKLVVTDAAALFQQMNGRIIGNVKGITKVKNIKITRETKRNLQVLQSGQICKCWR